MLLLAIGILFFSMHPDMDKFLRVANVSFIYLATNKDMDNLDNMILHEKQILSRMDAIKIQFIPYKTAEEFSARTIKAVEEHENLLIFYGNENLQYVQAIYDTYAPSNNDITFIFIYKTDNLRQVAHSVIESLYKFNQNSLKPGLIVVGNND